MRLFFNAKSLNKIEGTHKIDLRFTYSGYSFPYEIVLAKAGKVTVNVNILRTFCIEIYKAINKINSAFMYQLFKLKDNNRLGQEKYKINRQVLSQNQLTFGEKSFGVFGVKIWNSLPYYITLKS